MLIAAGLFLTKEKYEEFEREVPAERWFRSQRKGLGYETMTSDLSIVDNDFRP